MPEKVIKTSDGIVMLSAGWYILIVSICCVSMACTNSQVYAYQEMQQDRDFSRIG